LSNQKKLQELKQKKSKLVQQRKSTLAERAKQIKFELPHLHGHKFYNWQRDFYESPNRINIVCAANQIGKSSTGIRRLINNATNPKQREKLFPNTHQTYKQQWYFYPDSKTLEREWNSKWVEWMPRGEMKDDPTYGWIITKDKDRGVPYCINWNSGVTTYFMYYSKQVSSIQASSPHEIFCDEEMPVAFYDEIMMRMISTDGIFNMFYTPTLNQMFWKRVMQKKQLKHAFTKEVSMFDCVMYEDGSPSTVFTREKIKLIEANCQNDAERQRRVYGKHVSEGGRVYYGYDEERNNSKPMPIAGYNYYAALDYGSGGEGGHPAAIVFIAVAQDYRSGFVFRCWRGDKIQTTAGDVVNKYIDLKKDLNITNVVYDHSAKDMEVIGTRAGVSMNKANKVKDVGEEILNTLLLSGALKVIDYEDNSSANTEQMKLMDEFNMLMIGQEEGDDLTDATRYCVCAIPWDFDFIKEKLPSHSVKVELPKATRPMTEKEFNEQQIKMRRGEYKDEREENDDWGELLDEFDEFNALAGYDE